MIDPDYFEKMYTTRQLPVQHKPPISPEVEKLHPVESDNFKYKKGPEIFEQPVEFDNFKHQKRPENFEQPVEFDNSEHQKEQSKKSEEFDNFKYQKKQSKKSIESELIIPMNTETNFTEQIYSVPSTLKTETLSGNSTSRIKKFTRNFLSGKIPRLCMVLILLLSLITNVIILHWKMTVSKALDTDFTDFPCNSYTFITTTVFITVILSFVVIYSFASNRSMDERIWIKPLIFTFLLIWILSPSLILLYIRKNCDSENIENYIIVNAWINVFVSGILILWFFISWNDFSNRIKIFFRGSNK